MRRKEKVQEAIRKEMSRIILEELHDPRIRFVTIIRAEITDDLRYAKIYYSVLGTENEEKDTVSAMKSASGFIRSMIAQRLNLRFAPEIMLKLDNSIKYSIEIEKTLESLRKEECREPKKTDKRNK